MTREEKLAKFGDGPWLDEIDRLEFKSHGLHCIVSRNDAMGFLCGYVAVPPEHALHGMQYEDVAAIGVRLRAHGGVNYSKPCADEVCHEPPPGEPDNVWWFGFHCGFGFDYVPAFKDWLRIGRDSYRDEYRTFDYVRREVEVLALQLAMVPTAVRRAVGS